MSVFCDRNIYKNIVSSFDYNSKKLEIFKCLLILEWINVCI